MKIAFVAYFFFDEDGVASLRARVLSEELKKQGHQLDIITKKSFGAKAQKSKLIWGLQAFKYLMTSDYDKLFVTMGPFWHIRFVLSACLLRKKKFIVDIRDPWSANLKEGYGGTKPRAKEHVIKRAEFWERLMYKHSEHIWTVTEGMKESHREVLGSTDKFTIVINGHDIDVEQYPKKQKNQTEPITYVCMGKFIEYGEQKAQNAMKKLRDLNNEAGQDYLLQFIGSNSEKIKPLVVELGMEQNVQFISRLPYHEAISKASEADIGFCIIRDETIEHGTKTFDYIGLGLPIFDCFEEGSHFQQFFKPYLTLTERKIIPIETRKKFNRRTIFSNYINHFN